MKNLLAVLLGSLLFFPALPAQAGSTGGNDPRVIVGGGMGSLGVGATFLFGSPTGTSPGTSPCVVNGIPESDCVFSNATETTFSTLTFDIDGTLPAGSQLECGIVTGGPFTGCSIMADADGAIATFMGGPGILPAADFSIEVDGWPAGQDFGVGANGMIPPDAPEPGTVFLLLTGMAGLWVTFRRRAAKSA